MHIAKIFILFVSALVVSRAAFAAENPRLKQQIECLSLQHAPIGEALRLISTVSGLPAVSTPEASKVEVSCYFTQVSIEVALQAMCRAHDLWVDVSPEGVLFVSTLDQHLASQVFYSSDTVETITVKYPSVYDVGDTLKGLFRDRIVWERPDEEDNDPMERLEMAMDRMDLLSTRSQFNATSTSSSSSSSSSSNSYNSSSSNSSGSNYTSGDETQQMEALADNREFLNQQLRDRLARGMTQDASTAALVYLSALPEINTLLIRSSDRSAVESVKDAIEKMDKPRGQVLLKVTILAVSLDDNLQTGVDWLIESGDFSSGFADSSIGSLTSNLSSYTTGTPTFSFVSDDIKLRAKLLAETTNVRNLANPTLLVADNEAANVFVGKNAQYLDQIEPGVTTISDGVSTTTDSTPTFVERNVGLSLLITPRIHADRTVTLRILQERSEPDPNLRDINYGTDLNVQVQDIDQELVVSTLVAKDRSLVILGGLVQEKTSQTDSGLPILKDIPLVGRLFSQKGEETTREELMVLIQPYVLAIPGEENGASAMLLEELNVDMTSPIEHLREQNAQDPTGRILERQMPLQK
jgi:general secretion pathway protein D